MAVKESNYVILVIAHKRPRFLQHVLESLKRQDELPQVQVWIDGHGNQPELREKVQACAALSAKYPGPKWIVYGMHVGGHKLIIDALTTSVDKFDKIIVCEDDCFPFPDAVSQYLEDLEQVEDDEGILTIYGSLSEIPGESSGRHMFCPWGWATTSTKLKRFLPELKSLYCMPEPEYLDFINKNLTEKVSERLNDIPQLDICHILKYGYSYAAVTSFISARDGFKHKPTSRRLTYNFGIGIDCTHFSSTHEKFFKPPYNMITEEDLIKRFNLIEVDWFSERKVECDKVYSPNSESDSSRFLVSGWGEPEPWGTWSVGAKSVIELGFDLKDGHDMQVTFHCKAFVTQKRPVLNVACRVNESKAFNWEFNQDSWQAERVITISARDWNQKRPAQIVFEIDRPVSPHELGLSDDRRAISLGVLSLQLKQVPSPVAAKA